MMVTRAQLADELRRLGLGAGNVVMVHSSLSSIGRVEGGADAVIEALLEVVGPTGTVMMPSFHWLQPYDPDLPSRMGAISERFRNWPGVARGFHPTHPVNAIGPKAEALLKDHIKSPTACGRETPFGRLMAMGGKILMLGVDNDRNTTMHTLEQYVEAPYLTDRDATYYDDAGRVQTAHLELNPGPHRNFIGLDPMLRDAGAEVMGTVGNAVARLIDAKQMHDVMLAVFKHDPALVLCDNPSCDDCAMQRRKIREARLRRERFTLSALASVISPYPDEIAHEMNRAGVYDLVLDRLYGEPVWEVSRSRLRRAAETFEAEGVAIGAVYCSSDSAQVEGAFALAESVGTKAVVAPFPPDPAAFLKAGKAAGVDVYFENAGFSSSVCMRLLEAAGAGPAAAFNPAAFAIGGEKPFLGVVNHTAFRRYIGMLYLADATFAGKYTQPARGNGEVKELLSVMRCRSFAGRVVIATGPGGPGFRELVEGFWAMMDGM
jgi:aminoglycoside 3-N-acetyltransferase